MRARFLLHVLASPKRHTAESQTLISKCLLGFFTWVTAVTTKLTCSNRTQYLSSKALFPIFHDISKHLHVLQGHSFHILRSPWLLRYNQLINPLNYISLIPLKIQLSLHSNSVTFILAFIPPFPGYETHCSPFLSSSRIPIDAAHPSPWALFRVHPEKRCPV